MFNGTRIWARTSLAAITPHITLRDNIGRAFLFVWMAIASALVFDQIQSNFIYNYNFVNTSLQNQIFHTIVYKNNAGDWIVRDRDLFQDEVLDFAINKGFVNNRRIELEGGSSYTYYWRSQDNLPAPNEIDVSLVNDDAAYINYVRDAGQAIDQSYSEVEVVYDEPLASPSAFDRLYVPATVYVKIIFLFVVGFFVSCAVRATLAACLDGLLRYKARLAEMRAAENDGSPTLISKS